MQVVYDITITNVLLYCESIFHDESSNINLVLPIYVIFIYWTTKLKKFDQIES